MGQIKDIELCWSLQPILGLWPITIQSMVDLGRLQARYPENFLLIFQLEVCQEGGVKKGVLGGY